MGVGLAVGTATGCKGTATLDCTANSIAIVFTGLMVGAGVGTLAGGIIGGVIGSKISLYEQAPWASSLAAVSYRRGPLARFGLLPFPEAALMDRP